MVELSGARPALGPVPAGVEVCRRAGRGHEVFVLMNHGRAAVSVDLPRSMRDVLNGGTLTRRTELAVEGVGVLAADGAGSR
jgi:beta-galactosidase